MSRSRGGDFEVLKHGFMSKPGVLSKEEAKTILEYGGDSYRFHYVLASDPVVEVLEAEPGDLIKVKRRSLTSYQSEYCRLRRVEG